YKKRVDETFPNNKNVDSIADLLVDWFHKLFLCLDSACSWFEVSTTGPFQFQKCEGDAYLQWRDRGYRTILYVLMRKVPDMTQQLPIDDKILLNKEVNRIVWDSNSMNSGGVTVECSDGSSYNGDHAIVTVSVGVLKNLYKNFVPELPTLKKTAIEAIAIGGIKKILLKFENKWWPDDLKGFSFVWTEADRKKILEEFPHGPSENGRSWLEDVYGFYVIDSHPRVLMGWVVGPMVEEVEKLSDDIVLEGSLYLLKKFVGHKYNVTQVDGVLRGAYTYPCLNAEKRKVSHENLTTPVINSASKPVLLFAGEGTHSKFYSTVHGAIETGFREADRILNIYK
ncbi:Amino oxidase domain containing protein, partial [Asbolus verrucosus]